MDDTSGVDSFRSCNTSEERRGGGDGRRILFGSSSTDREQKARVFLRIKPTATVAEHRIIDSTSIAFVRGKTLKRYEFTRVFPHGVSQEEVFEAAGCEELAAFIDGRDCTVLAYGASGSGKTHTLMGNGGVVPRCLRGLFAAVRAERMPQHRPHQDDGYVKLDAAERREEIKNIESLTKQCLGVQSPSPLKGGKRHSFNRFTPKYEVWVSFTEIYNDAIYDLLVDRGHHSVQLRLMKPNNNRPFLKDVKWIYVRNTDEAHAVLEAGKKRLRYAHTNMNSHSSRSHCLFTLKLLKYDSVSKVTLSTFRLYDLAGSERVKRTLNEGVRLEESRNINTSLHVLERCLTTLRNQQDGRSVVLPYRESKLTTLLQNALLGNETITMLVTISLEDSCMSETQQTLLFSAIANEIITHAEKNKCLRRSKSCMDLNDSSLNYSSYTYNEITYLKEDIIRLKDECDKKVLQKEREVRKEMYDKFTDIKKKADLSYNEFIANEQKRLTEMHKTEMERLKENLISEHNYEIEVLTKENDDLKAKLKYFEEKYGMHNKLLNTSIDTSTGLENIIKKEVEINPDCNNEKVLAEILNHSNENDKKFSSNEIIGSVNNEAQAILTSKGQSNNILRELQTTNNKYKLKLKKPIAAKSNQSETPIKNAIDEIEQSVENLALSDEKENKSIVDAIPSSPLATEKPPTEFFTVQKAHPEAILHVLQSSVMGSSRRKLFTKRENNETAGETKEPAKSQRHLDFEEDSPGQVQPPKMEKPYVYEKPVRSTRKRNKKI